MTAVPLRYGRALRLVTPPEVEPLTPAEVRDRLGLSASVTDNSLNTLIKVARMEIDGKTWLGRALIDQTWDLVADAFPAGCDIPLPLPPLLEVLSVNYVDEALVEQTLDPLLYGIDMDEGFLIPFSGWPATADVINAIRIRYRAGYGEAGEDVPEPIRQWIALRVGTMRAFSSRSDPSLRSETVEGVGARSWETSGSMATAYQSQMGTLLDPYRIWFM